MRPRHTRHERSSSIAYRDTRIKERRAGGEAALSGWVHACGGEGRCVTISDARASMERTDLV